MGPRGVQAAMTGWAPALWGAFVTALAQFPPQARARGRRYADEGRVEWIEVLADRVEAMVVGSEAYDVAWEYAGGDWSASCSCPIEFFCKHAYAAACCLLGDSAPPTPARPPAPPARGRVLERLLRAQGPWERQQVIGGLLPGGWGRHGYTFHELLDEPDRELFCWRVVQALAGVNGAGLPPDLEPYRDRPDLAARLEERRRMDLLGAVVGWARHLGRTAARSLRVVLTLGRDPYGAATVGVEARLTSPRMADAPRSTSQLQQLRTDLQHDPSILPVDQAALLVWLTDHGLGTKDTAYMVGDAERRMAALPGLLERIAASTLGAWGDSLAPDLAALGGVVAGAPVRFSAAPARLVPSCISRDGATGLEMRFLWPDGRSCGLGEALYLPRRDGFAPHSSLVLHEGEFATVVAEPPAHLLARFGASGGLVLRPEERVSLLPRLAAGFPHLRETLRVHTRVHPVASTVTLDLSDDDRLTVRVFAHSVDWRPGETPPAGGILFELTPEDGWAVTREASLDGTGYEPVGGDPASAPTAPAATPAEVWCDEPDPECVAPVTGWLERLGVAPASRAARQTGAAEWAPGWSLSVRRRMDAFAEAWAERPAGTAVYGTERVRRLLDGSRRVSSRIRIEASGIDWFSVSAEWEAEGLALTDADLAALRSATTRFVRLAGGWVDRELAARHDDAAGVLADLGVEAGAGPERLTLWQLAGARPESLAALERLGADPGTLGAVAELRRRVAEFRGLPAVAPPPGLRATLRPYQQHGLDFLAYSSGLGVGAILADDMGLGKTVQALAWIAHLRAAEPDGGPSLVVCPASVVHNWAREAARFTPDLRVLLLTRGSGRHALRGAIAEHDVVVTNYALLRHDLEAWRAVALRALVLDEAQNVKNPDAAVTRAALALDARHRLALTGTPLENRPLDLWSIMSCVNPGYLGSRRDFTARYDRLDVPAHRRALLAARLRPVLLRRLKHEVAPELPERVEERSDCELTPGQRRLYLAELARSRRLVERLSDAPGGLRQHRIDVLAALTRLRQICCHPALAGGKVALGSGKFEALFELLEPLLAEGHKVLVFSQFVECLMLLAAALRARRIPHHMLTGQTVKRAEVVGAFTDDPRPCVFLVSLKAGGTGLNLTAASYVVLFDPWWNPAVEAQAIDRTHRIGQDRTVIAYRLVARGTIEERIFELQQRKAALARDVLGEGDFGRALTREDLGYLLAGDKG
jgi:superfamily II DNA or RNA helicase